MGLQQRRFPLTGFRPRASRAAAALLGVLLAAAPSLPLAEILANLCDNAARFARHRVLVAGRRDDDATILLVEDDGRGIPDDKIEQALKRGGRLDQTASGSGLGLAIVADLAAAYGGSVRLDRSGLGGVRATLRFADTRRPG